MNSILKFVGAVILITIFFPVVFYMSLIVWGDWHDEWSGYNASNRIGNGKCNIAVLQIMGEIHTYGNILDDQGNTTVSTNMSDALSFLGRAETEPGILGVMSLIDSPGGSPAAAELITSELQKSKMPNAAYIVDSGTSAAYLIATGADTIIASPFADVGSIGVTMSYLEHSKENTDQGVNYVALTSAKYKDYGSPDKPLTPEERKLLERDLGIWHNEFVKEVSDNRNLPLEDVAKIADGSSMPATLALDAKLIDAIGDKEVARKWFAEKLNMPDDQVIFCQ